MKNDSAMLKMLAAIFHGTQRRFASPGASASRPDQRSLEQQLPGRRRPPPKTRSGNRSPGSAPCFPPAAHTWPRDHDQAEDDQPDAHPAPRVDPFTCRMSQQLSGTHNGYQHWKTAKAIPSGITRIARTHANNPSRFSTIPNQIHFDASPGQPQPGQKRETMTGRLRRAEFHAYLRPRPRRHRGQHPEERPPAIPRRHRRWPGWCVGDSAVGSEDASAMIP